MAWVYRHLAESERAAVFNIIVKTDSVGEFLSELNGSLVTELVNPPFFELRNIICP
jgi:magnesium transporter